MIILSQILHETCLSDGRALFKPRPVEMHAHAYTVVYHISRKHADIINAVTQRIRNKCLLSI